MKISWGVLVANLSGYMGELTVRHRKGLDAHAAYIARKSHRALPRKDGNITLRCDCECFKVCDALYQTMTPAEKAIWRAAIKKSKTSTYDVWMKECLTLCNAGQNLPDTDTPGPGGGWSGVNAIPGSTPPPEVCMRTWTCDDSYTCVPAVDGPYSSLPDCEAACHAPPEAYTCSEDYECIADAGGEYATLAECEAACVAPLQADKWYTVWKTAYDASGCTGTVLWEMCEDWLGQDLIDVGGDGACLPQPPWFPWRSVRLSLLAGPWDTSDEALAACP